MTTSPVPAGRSSSEEAGGHLAALFDAHGHMVLGLCRYLLRDADEAEDATQQTFLSAYRSLLSGSVPRRPSPWLAEIARNECRTRIVARMREPLSLAPSIESYAYGPVEIADQTEVIDELKRAISELPDRQREAVVLRDFYGLSYREVASAMTVSVPVVEALLFRARRHLVRRLGALPRLAQGALTVPLALRDELARLIPGFDSATTEVGVVAGSATLGGVAAKLAALPASAKVATASTVAAVAVGGAAVTPEVIDRQRTPTKPAPVSSQPQPPSSPGAAPSGGPAASDAAAVELVRRETPGKTEEEEAPEVEQDDELNEESSESGSAGAREPEVETEAEPEAAEAETEDAEPGPTRTRPASPEPEPEAAETEVESDETEDEGTD
jgi:RNA polymerase sigma-70 factor, ECF subfamily